MKKNAVVVCLLAVLVLCSSTSLFAGEIVDANERGGALGVIERAKGGRLRVAANAARDPWSDGAESFARGWSARRGGAGLESFVTRNVLADELGQVHVRLTQTIAGVPVHGVELVIHADQKTGRVLGVNGSFVIDRDLPRVPQTSSWAAIENAAGAYGIAGAIEQAPELAYVAGGDGALRLAWTSLVRYEDEFGPQLDRIYADALTGEAVARQSQYQHVTNREVYTCNNTTTRPGTLVRDENDPPSSDPVVNAAFDNLGITYDYYKAVHNRSSYNASDAPQKASVHYGNGYESAFWDQANQLVVFGDGDTAHTRWDPLAYSLDITAHEFTHGVIHYSSGLNTSGEPGALGESLSDCVGGAAAQEYRDSGIDSTTWQIGEEAKVSGALRYINDPDTITGHKDFYPLRDLGGDVHKNAGIQNVAFYLLVAGGTHPDGDTSISVDSIGMEAASKIFYRAMTGYATATTNFRLMRDYTLQAASDIYGSGSTERAAVADAWDAVGNDWTSVSSSLSSGGSYISASYFTSNGGIHTGHLSGPIGANFDLYLERYNTSTSTWVVVASRTGSTAKETLENDPSLAATFRWRVQAVSGSGSFQLHTNWPE